MKRVELKIEGYISDDLFDIISKDNKEFLNITVHGHAFEVAPVDLIVAHCADNFPLAKMRAIIVNRK